MTPSPSPVLLQQVPFAYVQLPPSRRDNILLWGPEEEALTHFTGEQNVSDLEWARDGQWLVFVSSYNYLRSRENERNIFVVHPDGTGLQMITGEYVPPEEASGPYGVLHGQVIGGRGRCLVAAQGAADLAEVDAQGRFALQGVPLGSRWVRAVCQNGEEILQGTVGLRTGEGALPFSFIPVAAEGRGWQQASLSRDGRVFAGTFYEWHLNNEGKREYRFRGLLCDWQGQLLGELALPQGMTLMGVDWSPVEDQLVGALTGEEGAWLWLWDAKGESLGALAELPNPEQEIWTAANPVWSPDGRQVAFELRRWSWWEGEKRRTDLVVFSVDSKEVLPLVEVPWGNHAGHPSWSADGTRVFYQLAQGAPGEGYLGKEKGDIYSVALRAPTPTPWTKDGQSYLPAANPRWRRSP